MVVGALPINYYTITQEQAKRNSYIRTLHDEIVQWGNVDENALNSLRVNQPEILTYRKKMIGQNSPVSEYADWTYFLLTEYGPRKRCLSLGSGVGRVEKYLVKIGFAEKMETFELCADANESVRLKDAKIDTQVADLNFIELPPDSYDFILCHCVLHHLINLEHVLRMINIALKKDGLFLVYEYVGETRWQFTKQRLDFLRRMFPGQEFQCLPLWAFSGFEAIRSGEILELLQEQFGDTCKRSAGFGGIYYPFLNCLKSKDDIQIDHVIELDEKVAREGTFPPCYYIGLYGKSNNPGVPARRWSDDELDSRLISPAPLYIQVKRLLNKSPAGPFLRWVKRTLTLQSK